VSNSSYKSEYGNGNVDGESLHCTSDQPLLTIDSAERVGVVLTYLTLYLGINSLISK